jgi:rubrerythrin
MIWICNRCGRELAGNPRFCPYCGHTIDRPKPTD